MKFDFYPVGSRGKDMDMYKKLVERDLTHLAQLVSKNSPENLTVNEKMSLEHLQKDTSI